MSGHRYITDTENLFTDDDVDDETFLRNSRRTVTSNYHNTPVDPIQRLEQEKMTLMERRKEIEDRTVNSTQRSLGLLRDSEQVGIATAEELQRQREQLERTDKRLDEINSTLRFSQKHINGIKSIFGSFKNYLSGRNEAAALGGQKIQPSSSSSDGPISAGGGGGPVKDAYSEHPLTRIRGEGSQATGHLRQASGGSRDAQAIINANLEEMCDSIVNLKGLAVGLSSEIDTQNDLIDNISNKVDRADLSIHKQNKDMNKILKKSH